RAAYCRLQLARAAYRTGDTSRALRMVKSALKSVETVSADAVVYQCEHLIGCVERERGRSPRALEAFLRSVGTIERMRVGVAVDEFKATFLHDKVAVYEDAIAFCVEDGRDELILKAFELVESSKSRALAELIAKYAPGRAPKNPRARNGSARRHRAGLQKLIEDINWYASQAIREEDAGRQASAAQYRKTVVRCEREMAELCRRVGSGDAGISGLAPSRSVTAHDLCDSLAKHEASIEYFITGDQISAFVATRSGLRIKRHFGSLRRIELILSGLQFQLRKFGYGSDYLLHHQGSLEHAIDRHLLGLKAELFDPLEDMVAERRMIIIPHGPLHYVPFHALGDSNGYLNDRFEISYAPSAAVLNLCRGVATKARRVWRRRTINQKTTAEGRQRHQLVAFGISDPELPNIGAEIRDVAAMFPDSIQIMDGDATRETLFRVAPSARYLHVATHGYFRRDNPMFSYLKLADCRLNFYSLLDLNLNAEMVTLSACHTGAHAVMPGDELHGLMRGFLHAGAPSMVISLWSANDGATAMLMKLMYQNLRAGESKRSALRKAQLAVR
ncbi:MAG: CHAT domain-containing protein, partial [Blastocatellia bacterium]